MDRTRAFFDRFIAWSPVLLLGGLAALTYWLDAQIQTPAARRDGSTRHDPDLFLKNFRAVKYDETGKPKETLAALRADHFPDDETAELEKPMFRITQSANGVSQLMTSCRLIRIRLPRYSALALVMLALPAVAGPPFAADGPEPTSYRHFDIYTFNNGTNTRDGRGGRGRDRLQLRRGARPSTHGDLARRL